MARKATGAVVEHTGKDGRVYRSLRFTAYGKRRFVSLGPVGPTEAERELRHVLADVERATWAESEPALIAPEPEPVPTFHQLAEQWWIRHEPELRPNTLVDYRTRLERHLLPFFAGRRVDEISYDLVEQYISARMAESKRRGEALEIWHRRLEDAETATERRRIKRERPPRTLSPRTINMTLTLLAAILEGAVERGLIPRNPAKGKSRRVREHAPRRSYLDTSQQIEALLNAAAELDVAAREDRRHVRRRAIVATLLFAGVRIEELCALTWAQVDLATGWLHVGEAKTDAGADRRIKIRGALRDELASLRADRPAAPDSFVFATSTGGRPSPDNIRNRVLAAAVDRASSSLLEQGMAPLPPRITPHSLRRTFASVLYALGEDPGVVMDEMGHTDPGLALRIYRQAMRRDEGEKERLRALVDGAQSTSAGQVAASAVLSS